MTPITIKDKPHLIENIFIYAQGSKAHHTQHFFLILGMI